MTGVGLVLVLGLMYVKERGVDRRLAWLAGVPAGLIAYLGFTAAKGYGLMAPFAGEGSTQYHHHMAGSLQTVVSAVQSAASGARALLTQPLYQPSLGGPFAPSTDSILLLAVLGIAIVTLLWAFRRLPIAYGAYSLAVLLVCTWSPVDGQPLKSFDRYALTIFPLWMAAGAWLSERRRGPTGAAAERRAARVLDLPVRYLGVGGVSFLTPGQAIEMAVPVQWTIDPLNSTRVAVDHLA